MTSQNKKDSRAPLTRDKIVLAALDILDANGLEGLSMRRLGEALSVEAMALYHHFSNKDAILDAVVEQILIEVGQALPVAEADQDWKAVMMSGPAATGRAIEAHPKAGWLFLGRDYGTAESLRMLEAPLRILYTAGFRGQQLVDAAHAIFAFSAGWYILASGEGGSWSGPSEGSIEAAGEAAPLATQHAAQLRDWNQGMEDGLMALMEGLEARLPR